jgi:TPR repeat protein
MLSQCQSGDENGRTINEDAKKLFEEINQQKVLTWERLEKSANFGVAQACQDVALGQTDKAEAYRWHKKAADLGLAAGMRYFGLQLLIGGRGEEDKEKAIEFTLQAAAPHPRLSNSHHSFR